MLIHESRTEDGRLQVLAGEQYQSSHVIVWRERSNTTISLRDFSPKSRLKGDDHRIPELPAALRPSAEVASSKCDFLRELPRLQGKSSLLDDGCRSKSSDFEGVPGPLFSLGPTSDRMASAD